MLQLVVPVQGGRDFAKLSLIDLAGSERAKMTGTVDSRKALREGAKINRSLLSLANCINALAHQSKKGVFVPYRDSKLTRLLKDSLGGGLWPAVTVMIATVCADAVRFDETRETLVYANRAARISLSGRGGGRRGARGGRRTPGAAAGWGGARGGAGGGGGDGGVGGGAGGVSSRPVLAGEVGESAAHVIDDDDGIAEAPVRSGGIGTVHERRGRPARECFAQIFVPVL